MSPVEMVVGLGPLPARYRRLDQGPGAQYIVVETV